MISTRSQEHPKIKQLSSLLVHMLRIVDHHYIALQKLFLFVKLPTLKGNITRLNLTSRVQRWKKSSGKKIAEKFPNKENNSQQKEQPKEQSYETSREQKQNQQPYKKYCPYPNFNNMVYGHFFAP